MRRYILFTSLHLAVVAFSLYLPNSLSAQTYSPGDFYYTLIGGAEKVDLSSQPSEIEPFVRFYVQSSDRKSNALWGTIRLLGAPNQGDTKGVFSVFTNPTGQITTDKLSSVGTAVDFAFGPSHRLGAYYGKHGNKSIDAFLAFGATTPLESNKVTQAFTVPALGTIECNTLATKFAAQLTRFGITKTSDGTATGSTNACLINTNAPSTAAGGSKTFAPVNTLAFSSPDRTSFLLKDALGIRMNNPISDANDNSYMGSIDFLIGMDASITGGVFRGDRWILKADALFPIPIKGSTIVYAFGSFSTRFRRNLTDNSPLILQSATLSNTPGANSVPSPNVVVLPLAQPDRDFYRIGFGVDVLSLFK